MDSLNGNGRFWCLAHSYDGKVMRENNHSDSCSYRRRWRGVDLYIYRFPSLGDIKYNAIYCWIWTRYRIHYWDLFIHYWEWHCKLIKRINTHLGLNGWILHIILRKGCFPRAFKLHWRSMVKLRYTLEREQSWWFVIIPKVMHWLLAYVTQFKNSWFNCSAEVVCSLGLTFASSSLSHFQGSSP